VDLNLKLAGPWSSEDAKFGYDFWYQPHHDIMVSSEWGAPKSFRKGFIPEDTANKGASFFKILFRNEWLILNFFNLAELYGSSINFWSWKERKIIQSIDLGEDGIAPLEIRFLHNPLESQGYVGCALNAVIYR